MDAVFNLTLIRHFPTIGNEQRRYIGWTDEPILPICVEPLDLERTQIISSDLQRTQQTAALLFPTKAVQLDQRWRECNFGQFEGKTYADLEKNKQYRQWINEQSVTAPPGGESLQMVEQRILAALQTIHSKTAVVTHGGPIRIILTRFAPEEKPFWSWDIPHGVGYQLQWSSLQRWKEGARCTSLSVVPLTVKQLM